MSYRQKGISRLAFIFQCLILGGCLLIRDAVGRPRPDDVYIKTYHGELKRTNSDGGFFVDVINGRCQLNAIGGSIKLGLVKGDLTATTSVGDIEIVEVKGNVNAITQAGNILIEKAQGHVYAETAAGEISIHFAKSADVNNILGGDVKLFNISGYSKAVARGNILLVAEKKISIPLLCDFSTIEGDITLYLPEDFDADIEVKKPITKEPNKETKINSDFSFIDFKQACTDDGKILLLTTRINRGGTKIILHIEKGNIYFKSIKTSR